MSVKQFLVIKRILMLRHPLYSPELAPFDPYLFPKVKHALKLRLLQIEKKDIGKNSKLVEKTVNNGSYVYRDV